MCLSACKGVDSDVDEGKTYTLNASFAVDSTVILDHLVLYADSHVSLHEDSLILSPEQSIHHIRRTSTMDEIYLCADGGELCRFYAEGSMEVNFSVSGSVDSLLIVFEPTEKDSINPWLQQQILAFEQYQEAECRTMMDSLCHLMPSDIRCALLLREEVGALNDSVFVRRCLGALAEEAKPEWLVKSIDELLSESSSLMSRNRRLSATQFVVNDSTMFDMGASRSDYLLVCFWAEYDQASIDSLRAFSDLIQDEYDMKRLQLLSCCLYASDSTAWQRQIEGHEGMHVWLPAGLADKRVRDWGIVRVPSYFVCDMYNNQQQRNLWGKDLRNAMNRMPNRSGFAHTPKTKPKHGR